MSSVSNMACLTVLVSFQSLWCTEVQYCVENSNLSTPEFWWVLVSRQSRFGCMIRSQKMSSVSNMVFCWVYRCLLAFKASGAQRLNIVWTILICQPQNFGGCLLVDRAFLVAWSGHKTCHLFPIWPVVEGFWRCLLAFKNSGTRSFKYSVEKVFILKPIVLVGAC